MCPYSESQKYRLWNGSLLILRVLIDYIAGTLATQFNVYGSSRSFSIHSRRVPVKKAALIAQFLEFP